MINVEMVLPEFAKGVHRALNDKSIPQLTFSASAFDENEYELLGSAVKYCSYKRVNVIVLGELSNEKNLSDILENVIEVEAVEYGIKDLKKLGKRIKDLANQYIKIYILADYSNLCLNCGTKISKELPMKFGDNNYWHKKDGVEFSHTFTEDFMETAYENLNKIIDVG
jgi:hypothetical protein